MGIWSGVGSQFDLSTCTSPSRPHVFDAFESLPGYGQASTYLENSEAAVRHNFDKYGLLDQRVKFYKGLSGGGLPVGCCWWGTGGDLSIGSPGHPSASLRVGTA